MVALFSKTGAFGLTDVLMVCVPSTLIGVLAGAISVRRMGVELLADPVYNERLARGELADLGAQQTKVATPPFAGAKSAGVLFVGAALLITLLGLLPEIRPDFTIDGHT